MVNYTEEQLKKQALIKDHIEPMLMSLYPELDEVHVSDHCIDTVNVTGDNLITMLSDIITFLRWR